MYVGSDETLSYTDSSGNAQTATCLVSKSGLTSPSMNHSRTVFYDYARANGTVRGIGTDVTDDSTEAYLITTLSEVTEIRQVLLTIKYGTKNAQRFYQGVTTNNTQATILATDVTAVDNPIIYVENSSTTQQICNVGAVFSVQDEAFNTGTDHTAQWRRVKTVDSVTGTIADGIFTADASGTTYLAVTLTSSITDITVTIGTTCLVCRPRDPGETADINAASGTHSNNGKHSFKEL